MINLDWRKDDGVFVPMLNDTGRNEFYKRAIESCVNGKTVVDVGSGTGLLTVLAVKAGATHVWAIEQDADRAELTRQNIEACGFSDRVTVVHDDFLNTDIDADYYVTETINAQLWGEGILEIADHAAGRGGVLIPGEFEYWFEVYRQHPLMTICSSDSEAYAFQPDIEIDPKFEEILSSYIRDDEVKYRSNVIDGLFKELPKMPELHDHIVKLYETPHYKVDLNSGSSADYSKFRHRIEQSDLPDIGGHKYVVVMNWVARHGDIEMRQRDTWFSYPSKVLADYPVNGIEIYYEPLSSVWFYRY